MRIAQRWLSLGSFCQSSREGLRLQKMGSQKGKRKRTWLQLLQSLSSSNSWLRARCKRKITRTCLSPCSLATRAGRRLSTPWKKLAANDKKAKRYLTITKNSLPNAWLERKLNEVSSFRSNSSNKIKTEQPTAHSSSWKKECKSTKAVMFLTHKS